MGGFGKKRRKLFNYIIISKTKMYVIKKIFINSKFVLKLWGLEKTQVEKKKKKKSVKGILPVQKHLSIHFSLSIDHILKGAKHPVH